MSDLKWSFFRVWNDSLENRKEKESVPRDYIWASELGGAYVDRWLKMKGTKPSNPPNARSLRKFEAGNIWEWIIGFVLKRAGILVSRQDWAGYQYPNCLRVTGRLDYVAGGKPDWEKARSEVLSLDLPEFINRSALAIINDLQAKYPTELKSVILEIKSKSTMIFDRHESSGQADKHHAMQLFHYLKATNVDEGHIVYVCKDDCRMIEIGVFNPSQVEDDYKADIQNMTELFRSESQPPKEPEVVFSDDILKFQKNWKVEYSNYLTMVYGYSEPEAFREMWDRRVASWNRVFGRIVRGDKMTKLNLDVIKEIEAYFPNVFELAAKAKIEVTKHPELESEIEGGDNNANGEK